MKLKDIEGLAEKVHKAYCQYCIDVKGKEYWTKGDYSLLSDKVKEADRYTVRAVLKEIELDVEEIKKAMIHADKVWEEGELKDINGYDLFIAQAIAKKCPLRVKP